MDDSYDQSMQSQRPFKAILGHYTNYAFAALPLRNFSPKVSLSLVKGNFLIKTADNWKEVESVLRLRYEVFLREGLNLEFPLGLDVDRWDPLADHLMVIDQKNGALIGTYRLISSCFSSNFYSQSEFELSPFLQRLGGKLELSRACIRADYRSSAAIGLLWKGIAAYASAVGARYLFGCASVKTTDPRLASRLVEFFKAESRFDEKAGVFPLPAFQMPEVLRPSEGMEADAGVREMIPPLLGSYLRAGAKIVGLPALDRSFRCIDFLTVLDFSAMNAAFERRYLSS